MAHRLGRYRSRDCTNHLSQFVMINLAYILATPVAAYIFLPVFYQLNSVSVYQ